MCVNVCVCVCKNEIYRESESVGVYGITSGVSMMNGFMSMSMCVINMSACAAHTHTHTHTYKSPCEYEWMM